MLGLGILFALLLSFASADDVREAVTQFRCEDVSQWSAPEKQVFAVTGQYHGHDISKCSEDWALKNNNEAQALTMLYLQGVEAKVEKARSDNDTAALQRFQRERICDAPNLDECYNEVRRRNLSHTVAIREKMLQNNRRLYYLNARGQPLIDAQVAQPGAAPASPPAGQARRVVDVINEMRNEKRPTTCENNPFIPCTVTFRPPTASQRPVEDEALTSFASAFATRTPAGGKSTLSSVESKNYIDNKAIEVAGASSDQRLTSQIRNTLHSKAPGNEFSHSEYMGDIRRDREIAEEEAKNPQAIRGYDENSPSWEAFAEAVDNMVRMRRESTRQGRMVDFFLSVRPSTARDPMGRPYLSTDGEINTYTTSGSNRSPGGSASQSAP